MPLYPFGEPTLLLLLISRERVFETLKRRNTNIWRQIWRTGLVVDAQTNALEVVQFRERKRQLKWFIRSNNGERFTEPINTIWKLQMVGRRQCWSEKQLLSGSSVGTSVFYVTLEWFSNRIYVCVCGV